MYKFFRTLHCVILEKMGGKKLRCLEVATLFQDCSAVLRLKKTLQIVSCTSPLLLGRGGQTQWLYISLHVTPLFLLAITVKFTLVDTGNSH